MQQQLARLKAEGFYAIQAFVRLALFEKREHATATHSNNAIARRGRGLTTPTQPNCPRKENIQSPETGQAKNATALLASPRIKPQSQPALQWQHGAPGAFSWAKRRPLMTHAEMNS